MSFIGRAAVWTHVNNAGSLMDANQSTRLPSFASPRLTPLNVMTGARIAASRDGVAGWAVGQSGQSLNDVDGAPAASRIADHLRRPYLHLFEAISRRTNRAPDPRVCPRCGEAAHNDWGHEYERLVCSENTAA